MYAQVIIDAAALTSILYEDSIYTFKSGWAHDAAPATVDHQQNNVALTEQYNHLSEHRNMHFDTGYQS